MTAALYAAAVIAVWGGIARYVISCKDPQEGKDE